MILLTITEPKKKLGLLIKIGLVLLLIAFVVPSLYGMIVEVNALEQYDPVRYYTEDQGGLLSLPDDVIAVQFWHPGYLDYFNYRQGDYGPMAKYFTLGRIIDAHALCSPELKAWLRQTGAELMNFRDALYGTRDYQNHLRQAGSPLFVG